MGMWVDKVIARSDRVPAPFDKVIDPNLQSRPNGSTITPVRRGRRGSGLERICAISLSQMGVSRTYFVKNAQQLCQKRCFLTCFGAITLSPYRSKIGLFLLADNKKGHLLINIEDGL